MNLSEFKLISTGIDIGTTTTQLIISELTLKDKFPGGRIPEIEIVNKQILYESKIYMTPILDHKTVDAPSIRTIIKNEYTKAGFSFNEIDTGAIIITGEASKKQNAEKIIHELAEYAGDFVVAIAGPELEAILAGKGSGASDISKENKSIVINLDIGGGTTNISIFENGNIVDTVCINVGGRLIEVEEKSNIVTYISKPAKMFIDNYDIDIEFGEKIDLEELEKLCNKMVIFVVDIVEGRDIPSVLSEILMTDPLKKKYSFDGVMYSGGVAEYIYFEYTNILNKFTYGDIGYFLGKAFKGSRLNKMYKLLTPKETIRATVIGAGTQTVDISGSTIFINSSLLPIRNIPVAKLHWDRFPKDYEVIAKKIQEIVKIYNVSFTLSPIALSIPCPEELSFENIKTIAKGVYYGWENGRKKGVPLVIVLEKDIGKVLGQTLYTLSNGDMEFLSIDYISVNDGDYIDIGRPISKDDVVPVIIKTLVFFQNKSSNGG